MKGSKTEEQRQRMIGNWQKTTLIILLLATGLQWLPAQVSPEHNYDTWWSLMGKVNEGLSIGEEVHIRRTNYLSNWQQFIFRPYVVIGKNPNAKFATGISYIHNYPYGEYPSADVNYELNGYLEGDFNAPLNRSQLVLRLRLEERFMWPDRGPSLIQHRMRYRAGVKTPLFTPSKTGRPVTLVIQDEAFFNPHLNSPTFGFNQNWLQTGLVYFPTEHVGFELGFMLRTILKPEPLPTEQNYTGTFQILWKWDRQKKS